MSHLKSPSPVRILIAEDVEVLAVAMAHALEDAGYDVQVARDGAECLTKVRESVPDLLLLDIMMPKMNGIEVLKAIRADEAVKNLAVIICSAKDFKTERATAAELGVLDYLLKPTNPSDIVERVQAALDRPGPHPEIVSTPPSAILSDAGTYTPVLDAGRTRCTLWGTRGSIPTLGGRFQRHGGNTSCMSITTGDDVIIFDAGSGIRDLGIELMRGKARRIHLFITHTHWDHIQGFPFFIPAYSPEFEITVYGSIGFGKSLEALFRGQLDRDYFPVQLEDMKSRLQFRHLSEDSLEVAGSKITWEFSHHPLPTVGYKIEVGGRKIAWVPDDEFLQGYTGAPHDLTRDHPVVRPFEKIISFLSGVDILIHEAQYMAEEYPSKIGWGHCSLPNACALMKLAWIPRWIVTHHDPMHDDVFLERKLSLTRQVLQEIGHPIPVVHGYDGMTECW